MCQFSSKRNNFGFFGPNLPKNEFLIWIFKNLSANSESVPPRYHVCQFSDKTDNFDFFSPNLPKNGFWGSQFQKSKFVFAINTSKILRVKISRQTD